MTRIIIVDEYDNIIGSKERDELETDDIYRVTALWLTDSNGRILLSKRHRTKKNYPLRWGPAVAGTVDAGESYLDNIRKETEEELGLVDVEMKEGPKTIVTAPYAHFVQWYTATMDRDASDFMIQEEEVEEVKWFSKDELFRMVDENPEDIVPAIKKDIRLLI